MSVLLDTHAFVWALRSPELLTEKARKLLNTNREVLVSAVSLYEIAAKVRLNKWPEAEVILQYDLPFFIEQGFRFVELTAASALRAGRMSGEHRDPFDRLIAATALEVDASLVSTDGKLDVFGIRRIW